jgi:hypothetical protein
MNESPQFGGSMRKQPESPLRLGILELTHQNCRKMSTFPKSFAGKSPLGKLLHALSQLEVVRE